MRLKPLWFLLAAALLLAACRQTPPQMSLALTATVGTVADVCADTSELALTETEPVTVYYCYTIENTGVVPLSLHDLSDDLFGAILRDFEFVLEPGASVSTVDAGLELAIEVAEATTNRAVWDGFLRDRRVATAEAESTVTFVPPAEYGAIAGTFVANSNSPTVSAFAGNIILLGVRDLDGDPIAEPITIDITVPGVDTFSLDFDPAMAEDGVLVVIVADFDAALPAGALGSLGFPVTVLRAPVGGIVSPSATVGGDFVIAFPGQTLVRAVDATSVLTVPAVTDVTVDGDEVTVSFASDTAAAAYQVAAYGRGANGHAGQTVTTGSPVTVELDGPLGVGEPFAVDIRGFTGNLDVFGDPVQVDVAEFLYLSDGA